MGALRDLAARLRAREVAAPEPVEVPAPPPPEARDGWGLTEAKRAAELARLEGAVAVAASAPPPPVPLPAPPRPAVAWWQLDYGAERGRAFMKARAEPGACRICAGRWWWRRAGTTEEGTCATCHPAPPRLAVESINAAMAAEAKGD